MRSSVPISIALVFAFCAPTLAQQIIYVDINADGPTEDGLTWCTAFRSLQDGLAATEASNGSVTEIRVANGTYTPDQGLHQTRGDQTASFALVDGVELRGGFAGCGAMHPDQQRPGVFETVLSGDLEANDEAGWRQEQENSFSVVVIDVAPGSASIEGFRVTGATVQVMGFRISDAGIVVVSGHANFRSCMIYDNHSSDLGGGAYIGPYASATVSSCTFADNSAFFGGGIYVNASSDLAITMTDCNFDKNIAFYLGGAACIVNREAQIARCRFFGNRAEVWGGAIFDDSGGGPQALTVSDSVFYANWAGSAGAIGSARGDVSEIGSGRESLTNCTIVGNKALSRAGGILVFPGRKLRLTNCIVAGNIDRNGTDEAAQLLIEPTQIETEVIVNHNVIHGWTGRFGGIGNFGLDPIFADPDGPDDIPGTKDDNYRLGFGSPCIDAGDNAVVALFNATDMDGNPRFVNDPLALNVGMGTSPIVDLGAYERQVVQLDILPQKCPNRVARRSNRNVRMAIIGTDTMDVSLIDPDSLTLTVGTSTPTQNFRSVRDNRWHVRIVDLSAPFQGDLCDCQRGWRDGIDDLLVRVPFQRIVRMAGLKSNDFAGNILVTLSGQLNNGEEFEATDCIQVVGNEKP